MSTPVYDQVIGEWEGISAQLAQIAILLSEQQEQLNRIEDKITDLSKPARTPRTTKAVS